jgi:hypothetical protein
MGGPGSLTGLSTHREKRVKPEKKIRPMFAVNRAAWLQAYSLRASRRTGVSWCPWGTRRATPMGPTQT